MSDAPAPPPDGGAPPAAPSAAPAPAAASSPASDAAADLFAELPADQAVYDRGWVDKVRREGQRYREEARTAAESLAAYNEVFAPYEAADRQVWLDIARQWVSDPAGAAAVMREIANSVLDEPSSNTPTQPVELPDKDTNGALTSEQVQQMIRSEVEARDAARAEQAAVESVFAELRAAGYDPKSREGFAILWSANNETDGDLAKAIELHKQYRQSIVDDYVKGRAAGNLPTPAPNSGVVANQHAPIKNLDDARRAADQYLSEQGMVRKSG